MATVITIINYDRTVITIVNYDHKTFIVQATDLNKNCVVLGTGKLEKDDITLGQADSSWMTPNQKSK